MMGEEAAGAFYQPGRFTRRGAMPITALKLLQDRGSVQLEDDEAHRRRKQMFMSVMTPPHAARLAKEAANHWHDYVRRWENQETTVLLDEVKQLLCRAVCAWAGVPLAENEVVRRAREFGSMIEGAGAVGPRNWRGLLLRARSERWSRSVIAGIRNGHLPVPEGTAAYVIATHRDADGKHLDEKVAAVELINVLRPTVAVALYVTFAALALHDHPECRQRLENGDDEFLEMFVQEVRRFYPFFPLVGGRVQEPFTWRGHQFEMGAWVLLDLYGTNHDPRTWTDPDVFRPERFRGWDESAFNLVPQGGGDHYSGHRCSGEWITIELMKSAVQFLTGSMTYDVPEQKLHVSLSRMPAVPKSRFIICDVRRTA